MKAGDIMTRSVITIDADSTVAEAAKRMLEHRISGMPVVDGQGRVIGVISEGDLLRRAETGTETQGKGRGSWWLGLVASASSQADAFTKQHGRTVRDAMSGSVISVDEDAPLNEVVELMESRRIKRVPVTRDRQVVGIISRANVMRVLTSVAPAIPMPTTDDRRLRESVIETFRAQSWAPEFGENVVVRNGVVQLWGTVSSEAHRKALVVAAQNVPGVKAVEDQMDVIDYRAEGQLLD